MLLAWLADIRPACRLVCRPVVISSAFRHLISSIVPSSNSLGLLLVCFAGAALQSACLPSCVPPCGSPFVPLPVSPVRAVLSRCDVIAALSDCSPCRSACGHQSPRHACRMAGSGTGRGAIIVIACSPCRCCLLARADVSPACVSSLRFTLLARSAGRFVSVMCWRNCIYDLSRCYNIM